MGLDRARYRMLEDIRPAKQVHELVELRPCARRRALKAIDGLVIGYFSVMCRFIYDM